MLPGGCIHTGMLHSSGHLHSNSQTLYQPSINSTTLNINDPRTISMTSDIICYYMHTNNQLDMKLSVKYHKIECKVVYMKLLHETALL